MKLTLGIIAAASLFAYSADVDCEAVYKTTLSSVEANKSAVLEVVTTSVEANQDCVCDIVKAAVIASEADKALVGEIVNVAIVASPDNMRLISQCAIAIAPDAINEVQKVLAKYTPQAGENYSAKSGYSSKGYSAKGAKGGDVAPERAAAPAPSANPLDGPTVIAPVPGVQSDPFIPIETVTTPSAQ